MPNDLYDLIVKMTLDLKVTLRDQLKDPNCEYLVLLDSLDKLHVIYSYSPNDPEAQERIVQVLKLIITQIENSAPTFIK